LAAPAAAALALLGLAARADLAAPHTSVTTVTGDLTVGTAFLVAGIAFRGPRAARALLVGVEPSPDTNRRVLAVLTLLRGRRS
jgi:hypothetical protein